MDYFSVRNSLYLDITSRIPHASRINLCRYIKHGWNGNYLFSLYNKKGQSVFRKVFYTLEELAEYSKAVQILAPDLSFSTSLKDDEFVCVNKILDSDRWNT